MVFANLIIAGQIHAFNLIDKEYNLYLLIVLIILLGLIYVKHSTIEEKNLEFNYINRCLEIRKECLLSNEINKLIIVDNATFEVRYNKCIKLIDQKDICKSY